MVEGRQRTVALIYGEKRCIYCAGTIATTDPVVRKAAKEQGWLNDMDQPVWG